MSRLTISAALLASTGIALGEPCPMGEWCQWTIAEGGNGHWYRYTSVEGYWEDGEAEAISLGGHLASIANQAEEDWVSATFRHVPAGSPERFWIGFTDDGHEGVWVWSSGEPVTYTNWAPGEPNNYQGIEHWAAPASWQEWQWVDYPGPTGGYGPCYGVIERETDPHIPAVSAWGMAAMTLLVLTAGSLVLARKRRPASV